MSLLLLFTSPDVVNWRHRRIKLISGNVYKLSFRVRATVAQTFNVMITDSTWLTQSLNANPTILADRWTTITYEFTAQATDNDSYLWIKVLTGSQDFYLDKFNLINLTTERKQYRIMRIQGSILPGSFIQTLTLREVTSAETA